MKMTIAEIEERIRQLDQVKAAKAAELNATLGAIEDCKYWIDQLRNGRKKKADNG